MRLRATSPTRSKATSSAPSRPRREATPARREYTIERAVASWIADGKAQRWSAATIVDRERTLRRFCWWLEHEAQRPLHLSELNPSLLREFLAYVGDPAGGRWGTDHPQSRGEVRPSTLNAYYRQLRAFTRFCEAEGLLTESPLRNVRAPKIPNDDITPFTEAQIQTLLNTARASGAPERDAAIILLLLDTGMRAEELCSLTLGHVNRGSGELRVAGKGKKIRTIHMGVKARRALWRHLEVNRVGAEDGEPVFCSWRGHTAGAGLLPGGLSQLVRRLGRAGGVQGVRCSPHTLRHTFAINFLRNGGNLFELQRLMGHEDLSTLRRYVKYAERDLAHAHRQASPADHMKLR